MTKFTSFASGLLLLLTAGLSVAQDAPKPMRFTSPPAETSVTIGGKSISIKYGAPSLHNRQMFGTGGRISSDPTYPVWRAGANSATALHTDAALDIKGTKLAPGDYTLFVNLEKPDHWQLIINKQTGEWGLAYDKSADLARIDMTMSKPSAPIETFKITLSQAGAKAGKLQMEWENVIASVPFTVQ